MQSSQIVLIMQSYLTTYGMKIVGALLVLALGWWLAGRIKAMLTALLGRRGTDPILARFAVVLAHIGLLSFVILAALGVAGIPIAPAIAVLGAAGLAVGLALQGSLSNFAAGVLLVALRPFKVGDYIEGGGSAGSVQEIQIFATRLKTPDNKAVWMPNSQLTSSAIVNYTANDTRRLDLVFGVSYDDDLKRCKEILEAALAEDSRVLEEPASRVEILEFADSSVNFAVRPWVRTSEYWDLLFHLNADIKRRFDEAGISIPYPQRDVHLYEHKS